MKKARQALSLAGAIWRFVSYALLALIREIATRLIKALRHFVVSRSVG